MKSKTKPSRIVIAFVLTVILLMGTVLTACGPKDEFVTVIFDVNCPSNAVITNEPDPVSILKGSKAAAPDPAPGRNGGYVFAGWYVTSECTGEPYDFETPVTVNNFTLYAKWEIPVVSYTVTYDYKGKMTNSTASVVRGATTTPPAVGDLEDCYFDGWYLDEGFTSAFTSTTPILGNQTVYAKWTDAVTLTFDLNLTGATGLPASQKFRSGSIPVQPQDDPESNGKYNFVGWYTSRESTGVLFDFAAPMTQSTTVYAKWDATAFDITYSYNYPGSPEDVVRAVDRDDTVNPPAFTRTGYSFGGWYTDAACTTAYQTAAPVISAFTLYAKWVIDKTLTYNLNYPGAPAPVVETYVHGDEPDLRTDFTRDGYTFGSWYTDADCTKPYTAIALTSNTIIYARWVSAEKPTFTISFSYNYDGAPANRTVSVAEDSTVTAPTVTRTGWTFVAWYTDPDCTTAYLMTTPVTSAFTLYAGWVIHKNITYDLNYAGAPSATVQSYPHGTVPTVLTGVTRANYTFGGWYTDTDCTMPYTASALTSNITVYARWLANAFDVTFSYNYTGSPANIVRTVNRGATVTPPAVERTGYVFAGWYTDAACTNRYDLATYVTSSFTLYAKWSENATVTYDHCYTGAPAPVTVTVALGTTLNAPANPVRSDATRPFRFWSTDVDGKDPYTFGNQVTANLTLYAQWNNPFVAEAEDVNFDNFFGFGWSGNARGRDAITNANSGIDDTRDLNGKPTASNTYYVSYLFCHDNDVEEPGTSSSLIFNITSDRDVTGAELIWRLSAEIMDMTIYSDTVLPGAAGRTGKYTVQVNGAPVNYGQVVFTGVPGNGEIYLGGNYKKGFEDYLVGYVNLVKGPNTIKLITDNQTNLGGTMKAVAPMVDCIKINSIANISWVPEINY